MEKYQVTYQKCEDYQGEDIEAANIDDAWKIAQESAERQTYDLITTIALRIKSLEL